MPFLVAAESFDVPAGQVQKRILSEGISSYPAQIICEYSFSEIRFDDEWGPGFIVTVRHNDESKPFFQLSGQVTKSDRRYVFSYHQGFEEGITPWDISYLVAPYSLATINSRIVVYGNGVLDFSTSVGGNLKGSGRVLLPGLSDERVLLNVSSAAGSYACEIL